MTHDLQHEARLDTANRLIGTANALAQLYEVMKTAKTDEERANVQRVIDDGTAEVKELAERLLQISASPTNVGNA
jgi:hypothetical protein